MPALVVEIKLARLIADLTAPSSGRAGRDAEEGETREEDGEGAETGTLAEVGAAVAPSSMFCGVTSGGSSIFATFVGMMIGD